jgi:hypothetical protein
MRHALLVATALVVGLDAQAPPRDQQPSPSARGTSVIRGTVVDADSGQRIRRASVTAFVSGVRAPDGQPFLAMTDDEGRFEITGLPAGDVNLNARHQAFYDPREDGGSAPSQKPYPLGDGQTVEGARLALRRTLAIAGRIVDEYGEPAIGIRVQAIRRVDAAGRAVTGGSRGPGAWATTDDTGAYRTWGLQPGRYLIAADPGSRWMGAYWGQTQPREGYAPTYYPGTTDSATAGTVVVRAGHDTTGVVFALLPARLAIIRGTLLTPPGVPARGLNVSLARIDPIAGTNGMTGRDVDADGRFEMHGVAPGRYRLTAAERSQRDRVTLMYGETQVDVNGEDLDGVVVALHRAGRITGRVTIDDRPLPAGVQVTVSARAPSSGQAFGAFIRPVQAGSDGTFSLEGAHGRLRVGATLRVLRDSAGTTSSSPPDQWQLDSIRLDGRDIADELVEIDGRTLEVEIAFSSQVTQVAGTVTWTRTAPGAERRPAIVVFPDDPDRWTEPSRWVKAALPEEDGRFVIRGLPAGDRYLAVAVDGGPFPGVTTPATLEALRGAATAFDLQRGAVPELHLRSVPPPQP